MDTKKIREIGKWMMLTGGAIFTSGAGICFVANRIDSKEAKKEHEKNMLRIEEESLTKERELKEKALQEAAEKDRLYSDKLNSMNDSEFAKFHADNVAKANEEVMRKADRIKKDADAEVTKIKLECSDEMDRIRSECLKKIEEANRKRDEAMKKYEAIDVLFTNKDKILKAKAALEEAAEKSNKAKKDKDELLDAIRDILD